MLHKPQVLHVSGGGPPAVSWVKVRGVLQILEKVISSMFATIKVQDEVCLNENSYICVRKRCNGASNRNGRLKSRKRLRMEEQIAPQLLLKNHRLLVKAMSMFFSGLEVNLQYSDCKELNT